MSQINTGIRSILKYSGMYDFVQRIMEPTGGSQKFFDEILNIKENDYVLDVGCGTANVLNYLPNKINYFGFDISEEYVANAKLNFGDRANFICGLLTEESIKTLPMFDVVIYIGVLHHLNDKEIEDSFCLVKSVMKDTARLVTIDPCFLEKQNPISKFLVSMDRGQNVRYGKKYMKLAESTFSNVRGFNKNEKFIPYSRWIMECQK